MNFYPNPDVPAPDQRTSNMASVVMYHADLRSAELSYAVLEEQIL